MIVYCWDIDGYAFESKELPDGSPLPENGALAPFPPLVGYQAARINAAHNAWDVVEDYFGALVRDTATGEMYHITTRGPLPEGAALVTEEDVETKEARASALNTLLQKRKSVEYGGVTFNGKRWDSEEKDELRLNSMITMMEKLGIPEFPGWKISADTFIVLTSEIAVLAAVAMMQHYNTCFAVEEAKKAEIRALESPEAIQEWLESSLNTGWPE